MMFLHATSSMERSDHGELLIGKKHVQPVIYLTLHFTTMKFLIGISTSVL